MTKYFVSFHYICDRFLPHTGACIHILISYPPIKGYKNWATDIKPKPTSPKASVITLWYVGLGLLDNSPARISKIKE